MNGIFVSSSSSSSSLFMKRYEKDADKYYLVEDDRVRFEFHGTLGTNNVCIENRCKLVRQTEELFDLLSMNNYKKANRIPSQLMMNQIQKLSMVNFEFVSIFV